MSRPIAHWPTTFLQSLRLSKKPLLFYFVFTLLGSLALVLTAAWYSTSDDKAVFVFVVGMFAGMLGIAAGQVLALLRLRAMPTVIAWGALCFGGMFAMLWVGLRPPDELTVPMFFFAMALPCGVFSLQHRYELLSAFWPAVGFIGSVFVILNREGRVSTWEQDKLAAWLPVPLFFLFCFVLFMVLFLHAKQTQRVEMWQALSGAAERRVDKRTELSYVPRKNLLPMLGAVVLLFAFTAILSPYLFRTGKGDHPSKNKGKQQQEQQEQQEPEPKPGKGKKEPFDGEQLAEMMKKMAEGAQSVAPLLWPLLFLLVAYRPAKRALLTTHLKTPVMPTSPSERAWNLWEYVRIGAEDAGVAPTASDSVEELLARIEKDGHARTPALEQAAEIYARSRYGFVLRPGDALSMRKPAMLAFVELRRDMTVWQRVKSWWRPLS